MPALLVQMALPEATKTDGDATSGSGTDEEEEVSRLRLLCDPYDFADGSRFRSFSLQKPKRQHGDSDYEDAKPAKKAHKTVRFDLASLVPLLSD